MVSRPTSHNLVDFVIPNYCTIPYRVVRPFPFKKYHAIHNQKVFFLKKKKQEQQIQRKLRTPRHDEEPRRAAGSTTNGRHFCVETVVAVCHQFSITHSGTIVKGVPKWGGKITTTTRRNLHPEAPLLGPIWRSSSRLKTLAAFSAQDSVRYLSVSYTHLTLPTIYSV